MELDTVLAGRSTRGLSGLLVSTGRRVVVLRRFHESQRGRRSNAGEQLLDARLPATAESKGKCGARMAERMLGGLRQLSGFKAELRRGSRDVEVRLVHGGAEARRGRAAWRRRLGLETAAAGGGGSQGAV